MTGSRQRRASDVIPAECSSELGTPNRAEAAVCLRAWSSGQLRKTRTRQRSSLARLRGFPDGVALEAPYRSLTTALRSALGEGKAMSGSSGAPECLGPGGDPRRRRGRWPLVAIAVAGLLSGCVLIGTAGAVEPAAATLRGTVSWTGGPDSRGTLAVGACPADEQGPACPSRRVVPVAADGSYVLPLPFNAPRTWNVSAFVSVGQLIHRRTRASVDVPRSPRPPVPLTVSARIVGLRVDGRPGRRVPRRDSRGHGAPTAGGDMVVLDADGNGDALALLDPTVEYNFTGLRYQHRLAQRLDKPRRHRVPLLHPRHRPRRRPGRRHHLHRRQPGPASSCTSSTATGTRSQPAPPPSWPPPPPAGTCSCSAPTPTARPWSTSTRTSNTTSPPSPPTPAGPTPGSPPTAPSSTSRPLSSSSAPTWPKAPPSSSPTRPPPAPSCTSSTETGIRSRLGTATVMAIPTVGGDMIVAQRRRRRECADRPRPGRRIQHQRLRHQHRLARPLDRPRRHRVPLLGDDHHPRRRPGRRHHLHRRQPKRMSTVGSSVVPASAAFDARSRNRGLRDVRGDRSLWRRPRGSEHGRSGCDGRRVAQHRSRMRGRHRDRRDDVAHRRTGRLLRDRRSPLPLHRLDEWRVRDGQPQPGAAPGHHRTDARRFRNDDIKRLPLPVRLPAELRHRFRRPGRAGDQLPTALSSDRRHVLVFDAAVDREALERPDLWGERGLGSDSAQWHCPRDDPSPRSPVEPPGGRRQRRRGTRQHALGPRALLRRADRALLDDCGRRRGRRARWAGMRPVRGRSRRAGTCPLVRAARRAHPFPGLRADRSRHRRGSGSGVRAPLRMGPDRRRRRRGRPSDDRASTRREADQSRPIPGDTAHPEIHSASTSTSAASHSRSPGCPAPTTPVYR